MTAPLASGTATTPLRAASRALREAPWIAAGGALGAMSRSGVATLLAAAGWGGLAATQAVNLVGAFALGFLMATLEATGPRPRLRAFVGIGLLGSFTTYSALVAEARSFALSTSFGVSLTFLAGSVALGLAAFVGGRALARGLRIGEAKIDGARRPRS